LAISDDFEVSLHNPVTVVELVYSYLSFYSPIPAVQLTVLLFLDVNDLLVKIYLF